MKPGRLLRRFGLPLAISVAVCAALLTSVDLSEFHDLARRVDWRRLPELIATLVLVLALFGLRWRILNDRAIGLGSAVTSNAIGLGGNQVLPARGGDIVRIVLTVRHGALTAHRAISALLVEKVLDLAAASLIGLLAIADIIRSGGPTGGRSTALLTAGLALAASVGALALARAGWLTHIVRTFARWLRFRPGLYRHAYRPIFHLGRGAQLRRLAVPILITVALWAVVYNYLVVVAAAWVGVPIGFVEGAVMVFASALGVALPAAPSALGTLHVAIVSAFVLVGRSAAEGLLVAVALHGVFFVGFLGLGLLALPLERRQARPVAIARP